MLRKVVCPNRGSVTATNSPSFTCRSSARRRAVDQFGAVDLGDLAQSSMAVDLRGVGGSGAGDGGQLSGSAGRGGDCARSRAGATVRFRRGTAAQRCPGAARRSRCDVQAQRHGIGEVCAFQRRSNGKAARASVVACMSVSGDADRGPVRTGRCRHDDRSPACRPLAISPRPGCWHGGDGAAGSALPSTT